MITVSLSAEEYFYKVVDNMLLNACKELQKLFQSRWKKETGKDWEASADQLDTLSEKLGKLYKNANEDQLQNIDKWDMTLMHKLLTNVWNQDCYKGENAAIKQLKDIRNELAHSRTKTLDKDMYEDNIKAIESSLQALGVKDNVIKEVVKKAHATSSAGENNVICSKPEDITDSTTWNELSEALKIVLGSKQVLYQGKPVKLNHFLENYNTVLPTIFPDGSLLVELANDNIPTLVNNQIPEQVSYYISRTITGRRRLDKKVFRNKIQDVFVVQGLEKPELTFLGEGNTDVSGNQIINLTVRFILLELEDDFEKICKLSSAPVHWIKYKDNAYEWVKSSGSMKNLQEFVIEKQDSYEEKQLGVGSLSNDKIVVISDSPGMGKTTLLANIAHDIMKHGDTISVRLLVLKELAQAITKKQMPINLETVIELIAEQSSDFHFGKTLLVHELNSKPCILMFDGFDEVLTHQIHTAKQILEAVAALKSARIFVTTRSHMREELENALHVFGYTIQPFGEEEQISFVLNFWKDKNVAINESVEQFAKSCLAALTTNMTDFEREIAGIPLQCKLFAESYIGHAERCSVLGSQSQAYQNFNPKTSLFQMYETHFEMRFQKLCTNTTWFRRKSEYDLTKESHMYHALELLFPEHKNQLLLSFSNNDICRHGILEVSSSNDIRFVHRTFAEYLVAWFVAENYESRTYLADFILYNVFSTTPKEEEVLYIPTQNEIKISLFKFNFPVICHFINAFIKNLSQSTTTERELTSFRNIRLHKEMVPVLFASAYHNYSTVPLVVNGVFKHNSSQKMIPRIQKVSSEVFYAFQGSQTRSLDIDEPTFRLSYLLLVTAKYSDVDLMSYFHPRTDMWEVGSPLAFACGNVKEGAYVLTPLHLAAQRGSYQLVEHLLKKFMSNLPQLRYLIHFCVFDSVQDNKATVEDKKMIIKLLMKISSQWINEKLPTGATPLILPRVNIELIEWLIEAEADVNALDDKKNTVLHKLADHPVLPETYHRILLLLDEHGFQHFTTANFMHITPLHWVLKKVELLPDTLQFFRCKGTDFNAMDKAMSPNSILFYAIRGGRSVEQISMLIELGAECNRIGSSGKTVIHACVKYTHYEALEYFLNSFEMDLNAKSRDLGETALHMAVINRSEVNESIMQLLIKKGVDVNASNEENEIPFIKAFIRCKGLSLNTIKLMEEHGLEITKELASEAVLGFFTNSYILYWESDKELLEAMEYLMYQKNGVIDSYCCRFLDAVWNEETFCGSKVYYDDTDSDDNSETESNLEESDAELSSDKNSNSESGSDSENDFPASWSPWKLKDVQERMPAIIQNTTINADLLAKAEECSLLTKEEIADIQDLTPNTLKCKHFYEILQHKTGSYERLCMILMSNNQTNPYGILKTCLSHWKVHSNRSEAVWMDEWQMSINQ